MIIDEDYRGMGVGEKLISKIKEIAKNNNLNEIEVSTSFNNDKAIKFYKNNGFMDESILLGEELIK